MRLFALSIGNTSVRAGWFDGARLLESRSWTLAEALRPGWALPEKGARPECAFFCSVVPRAEARLVRAMRRATGADPIRFTAESDHGLRIRYRRPSRLGADRAAAALGALALFPGRDAVVVDCGTATSLTVVGRDGVVWGGAIAPGMGLGAEALARGTAQLPRVPVHRPRAAIGRSPEEGIASGLFFGQVGAIRELLDRIRRERFGRRLPLVIGAGGGAAPLAGEGLFDRIEPDLVLHGLRAAAERLVPG